MCVYAPKSLTLFRGEMKPAFVTWFQHIFGNILDNLLEKYVKDMK